MDATHAIISHRNSGSGSKRKLLGGQVPSFVFVSTGIGGLRYKLRTSVSLPSSRNQDRTRKPTPPKWAENDAFTRPPNLSSASCDLDLCLMTPKVDRLFISQLCQLALKSVHSFTTYRAHNFLTEERSDRWRLDSWASLSQISDASRFGSFR